MFPSVELDFRRPIYPNSSSPAKNFNRKCCFKSRVLLMRRDFASREQVEKIADKRRLRGG
jgi:hypothetical protein